jgi:RNA polymerase-binding transcription factor DksA
MSELLVDLTCPACHKTRACDRGAIVRRLLNIKMLKADSDAENDLLLELFKSAAPRMNCEGCGAVGLRVSAGEEPAADEWQQARACRQCRRPIPAERLEVFPDAVLCVACQSGDERGTSPDAPQYCERCGQIMQLRQSRNGITRYVMVCPNCRR